ncbi:flavin reductase family protein [Micromonospora sp. CNB394]|uniref:flavin reductase family protein n=1 Tax=Micromonospora sp. CNB394 TaxID=1169151 RepID=UPI0003695775|nr:flavin reductase family protein [Micromonospora sp. CNB394]
MISADPSELDDTRREPLDLDGFRAAMASFPTGVTIVTTQGPENTPYGFTANSFCSVSLEPPMILVCLSRTARSFPVFQGCKQFAVSILQAHHTELARRFASKRGDKFAQGRFVRTANGLTVVDGAVAVIECDLHQQHEAGDHVILVGLVHSVRMAATRSPALYVDRAFGAVGPVPAG